MKVLTINPPVEDFTAYNLWAAPLGLLRIMEHFEKRGDDVTYLNFLDGREIGENGFYPPAYRSWGRHSYWKKEVDKPEELFFVRRKFNRFGASDNKIKKLLMETDVPDKILISTGMTYWYRSVISTIDIVLKVFPGVEIEVGGTAATLIPNVFNGIKGVHAVTGKYPVNEEITGTGSRYVDHLKFFPANLVEGCPNRCSYCSSSLFYPEVKIKNIEKQVYDLEAWNKRTGFTDVAFYDDALLLEKGRYLKEFLKNIPPEKYRFHTPNGLHLKEVDNELCKIFNLYDFPQLRFGFETAFNRFDRKTDRDQLVNVVEMLKMSGSGKDKIGVYLLCGIPGQAVEEVEETIDFVDNIGARPYLSEFSPVPGTVLYDKHLKESLLDFDKEPMYQNNSLSSWRSPVFNFEVMERLKNKLRRIYSKTQND